MKKINITKMSIGILWIILIIIGLSQNLVGFVTLLFFASILLGPFFCGWLCPFGFIQDMTNKIAKKANISQIKVSKSVHNVLKYLKYVLFVALLFPVGSFLFDLLKYDPRGNFELLLNSNTLAIFSIIIIIAFLMISLFNNRFFCKYLCVEGAKYSIFSSGRLFNIHRTSSCVECGKCTKACPMQIDLQKKSEVTDMTCINCMECITSCNVKDAIKYKPSINTKKIVILCISALLFAGYMLYSSNSNILDNNDDIDTNQNIQAEVQSENTAIENTYNNVLTGSAQGFRSIITVEVTMNGDEISSIDVVDHNDDEPWFERAISVIDSMLKTQSTDVDTVSGATYSSLGIINATKDALSSDTSIAQQQTEIAEQESDTQDAPSENEIEKPVAEDISNSEILTGTAQGFRDDITVEVTMNGDEISNIEVVDHKDDYSWFVQALNVIDDILKSQSTNVDTVSGATYSSQGIINATKDALGQDFEDQSVSGGHGKKRGNH